MKQDVYKFQSPIEIALKINYVGTEQANNSEFKER